MGTLRTLFAIAVVLAHSYGVVFVGGRNAVQLFYMISGFLISFVLVEKKLYPTVASFYVNRYLRLYPIYLAVAMLALLIFAVAIALGKDVPFFRFYDKLPTAASLLLVVANATLFLQDWVMFAGVRAGELVFAVDYAKSDVLLYEGLLVPQAWTLGIELSFYLIAPLVLPRRRVLVGLLVCSAAVRLILLTLGLAGADPWNYRFFPAELALFLVGALAHQVLLPIYRAKLHEDRLSRASMAATYAMIAASLVYWLIPVHELAKTLVLFAVFFFALPLTFEFQARRRWDKWVGDLSYPIYICHLLVINLCSYALVKVGITGKLTVALTSVLFSIAFAIALNEIIANPVERLRSRVRGRASGAT